MCWFNYHKWIIIKLWNYIDISFTIKGEYSCLITYQCKKCKKIKTEIISGHLEMSDLLHD